MLVQGCQDPDVGVRVGRGVTPGETCLPLLASMEQGREQVTRIHQVPMTNQATLYRTRTSVAYEDAGRSFQDAMGWITQKKVPEKARASGISLSCTSCPSRMEA